MGSQVMANIGELQVQAIHIVPWSINGWATGSIGASVNWHLTRTVTVTAANDEENPVEISILARINGSTNPGISMTVQINARVVRVSDSAVLHEASSGFFGNSSGLVAAFVSFSLPDLTAGASQQYRLEIWGNVTGGGEFGEASTQGSIAVQYHKK